MRHCDLTWLPVASTLLLSGFAVTDASWHAALAQTPPATQQPAAAQGDEDRLTQAQLEQLFAPIALYPDDLLMQMLMAATYPLEVVQAKRWLGEGQNAQLRGDALGQALNAQPWDPAVKSLVPFPDVLAMMNDQLDWTQQVGDAVLAQQDDVLNAVQVLRGRAQAAGALQSGPQQTVNVTQNVTTTPAQAASVAPPPQVITIAPTTPEQVYVPAYDPSVVYGSWPYPANPPVYYPPPVGWNIGNALLTGMAFAGGVAVVNSLWGWARPGWGRGDIDVNVNRYNDLNLNRTQINSNRWQHDVTHRHGVAYRNDNVRARLGGGNRPGGAADRVQAREQFRGRADRVAHGQGIGSRPGGSPGQRPNLPENRPHAGQDLSHAARRPDGPAPRLQHPAGGREHAAIQHRPDGRPQVHHVSQRAAQGFQGVGHGGQERAAAHRGAASRQGQPAARARAQQRATHAPARHGGGHVGHGGGRGR
ncbi:MAG: DUF3300 domain-containing protein [Acetobacteraceae bacterium]